MRRCIIFITLLILVGTSLYGQHKYSVQVRDSFSRKPIENVLILDTRGVYLAETHMQGKAWFEYNLPTVMVDIQMQGYQNKKAYLSASDGDASLILLSADTSYTPEAIVRSSRLIQNLSSTELQQTSISRTTELESLMPSANTVQDLVSNLSTTQTSEDPFLGSSVGLNGLGGQNVKLLIDGQPVTGRMSGNIDLSQFSLSDIQTVQVYYGPQSIIYGSDAAGGIINMVSFQHDEKFSGYVQGYYEELGRYNFDGHVDFTVKKNHFGLKLGRYYFDGLSLFDSLERQKTWLPKEQIFSGIHWRKKWDFKKGTFLAQLRNDYTLENLYNPGEPEISNTQQTATAFDYQYITHRDNASFTLSYWRERWKHNLQNSYSYFKRNTQTYFMDFVEDSKTEVATTQANYDQFSLFQSRYIAQNRSEKMGLQMGAEVNFESGQGDKLSGAQSRQEAAVFGIMNYRLGSWHLIPGLRWSYFSSSTSKLIPAFQITNQINDHWYLEIGYANAYRVASLKEMHLSFIDANHNIQGNPDLKPENTNSTEAGIKYKTEELKYNLEVKLSSAFYSTQDKIVLAANLANPSTFTYSNITNIENTSQVLDLKFSPLLKSNTLDFIASTNWLYFLEYGEAEDLNSLFQTFQLKWGITKWNADLSISSKSSISQRVFVIDTDSIVDRELSPFTMLHIGLSKRVLKNKLVTEIGVKNIMDIRQVDFRDAKGSVGVGGSAHGNSGANMLASPGRAFYLRLGYRF